MFDSVDLLHVLLFHGLNMMPGDLTEKERRDQRKILDELLQDNPASTLVLAIKYGMREVWPFSTDGRPFDAYDLRSNLLKAKAAVGQLRRSGRLPTHATYRRKT